MLDWPPGEMLLLSVYCPISRKFPSLNRLIVEEELLNLGVVGQWAAFLQDPGNSSTHGCLVKTWGI